MDGIAGGCGATAISEPAAAYGGGAVAAEGAEDVVADAGGADRSSAKGGPCESEGLFMSEFDRATTVTLRLLPAKTLRASNGGVAGSPADADFSARSADLARPIVPRLNPAFWRSSQRIGARVPLMPVRDRGIRAELTSHDRGLPPAGRSLALSALWTLVASCTGISGGSGCRREPAALVHRRPRQFASGQLFRPR